MNIVEEHDRIHVRTRKYEWTILKKHVGGRGPGYISDIRRLRTGEQILRDGGPPFATVNDPRYGGLFGFGVIVARPPDPPDPETFWNWCHELSTRRDADSVSFGYGLGDPDVTITGDRIVADAVLELARKQIATITWTHKFDDDDRVECDMQIDFTGSPGLYAKEPKITANGLTGHYRYLSVYDKDGNPGRPFMFDLGQLADPHLETKQIDWPKRYTVKLERGGKNPRSTFYVSNDRGLDEWLTDVADKPSFSTMSIRPNGKLAESPRYCTPKGELLQQWEAPHWPKMDAAGVLFHVWEGGYGAPDCWSTFRPWPDSGTAYSARLEARLA